MDTGRRWRVLRSAPTACGWCPVADDDTVRIWNATSWQPILGHEDVAYAEFSDDGSHIDSGSRDKTVRRWDAKTGRSLTEPLRVADDDVRTLFPVGDDRLLSLGSGNTVRMWDARTLKPIGEPLRFPPYPLEEIQPVVYTDETNRIAAETGPGLVQLYNADTMQPIGDPISTEDADLDTRVQPRRPDCRHRRGRRDAPPMAFRHRQADRAADEA